MDFRRFVIKIMLIFSVLSVFGCGGQKNEQTRLLEEAEKQIRQSDRLKRLDEVCRNLPVFDEFEPERKTIGRKNDILFNYYRLKLNGADVRDRLKEKMSQNGWNLKQETNDANEFQLEFEKENYWIQVSFHEFTELNYSTNCKDLSVAGR